MFRIINVSERTCKLTWSGNWSSINGTGTVYYLPEGATLYASPYLVVTPQGYTKHYYAEAERITSQLGKGQFADVGTPVVSDSLVQVKLQAVTGNVEYPSTLTVPDSGTFAYLDTLTNQRNAISTLYFYHPDHLGSSSWITTTNGAAVQHLHYLPWGEDFVNQRSTSWNAMYTFSAKEKDIETGYSYFGARYYSSDLSVWLSVDPMSDKYPSLSPYVYCADNPIKLVDPNGEEVGLFWPKRGVNTYSWKVKAGAGDGYGVAYSIMGGISLDRHGKTHWMAQNYKYIVNQNLYESSPNPAIEVGVDIGGALSFDRTWQFDSFIDALKSSTTSINIGGAPDFKIKALAGLSIGGGDGSFSFGAGLGLSLGFSSDPYFIIESISISTAEESTLKSGFTHWKVVNQKYNKQTNSFQGVLQAGNTKTNIIVSCSAVDVDGVPKPSRIWASDEYLKD